MSDIPQNMLPLIKRMEDQARPTIVTYCGSTSKCQQQFIRVQLYDTIRPEPRMFFTIGCSIASDEQLVQAGVEIDKEALDTLHFWKIWATVLLAKQLGVIGEICILDLTDDGSIYFGTSTKREMQYAAHLIEKGAPLILRFWSEEQQEVSKILRDLKV